MPDILLIEDDASVANALRDMLRDEGFHVTMVTESRDGLAKARSGNFDIVLTDLQMPGVTGLDCMAFQIRYRKATSKTGRWSKT